MSAAGNPLQPFFDGRGCLIVDGGLATTLEAHGHDLHDDLWSSRLLEDDPDALVAVHDAFLQAGADVLIAASYQATVAGFRQRGHDTAAAIALLQRSVQLAVATREAFLAASPRQPAPLVAASVGPYGASLADGSEYHGHYGVDPEALDDFHAERWELLAATEADLLACETIPAHAEVQVLLELMGVSDAPWAWLSVTCQDGTRLRDGSKLREVFAEADSIERLCAVGINCTAPQHVTTCIAELRAVTRKPIIVYPNSGERFDAVSRTWRPDQSPPDWGHAAAGWVQDGAQGVGGCCRVGPAEIQRIRDALVGSV